MKGVGGPGALSCPKSRAHSTHFLLAIWPPSEKCCFALKSCRTPARRWSQWPSFHPLALLHICCFPVCWISSCQVSDAYWLLQNSASHSQRKINWCWVGGEGGVAILDVSKHGSLLRINRKSWIKSLGFDKGFFSETIKDFFPLPLPSHPPKE